MIYILKLLTISCSVLLYTEIYGLNPFNFRPFNCPKCLSFWVTLIYLFCRFNFIDFDYKELSLLALTPITTLILWKLTKPF
jgi:hypothetical protein